MVEEKKDEEVAEGNGEVKKEKKRQKKIMANKNKDAEDKEDEE